jgi:LPXTG-motif cell wall-anchored protein
MQAAIASRLPTALVRTIVGFALVLSGGAVLIDGGFTRNGISKDANWWVIAFGALLIIAGCFLVRRRRSKQPTIRH